MNLKPKVRLYSLFPIKFNAKKYISAYFYSSNDSKYNKIKKKSRNFKIYANFGILKFNTLFLFWEQSFIKMFRK